MSDTSKGSSYESRFRAFLERNGYITTKAVKSVIWIPDKRNPFRRIPITRSIDFFGCIDIIAFHSGNRPVLVQVGTTPSRAKKRNDVVEGLSKIIHSTPHMDSLDILVACWGKWEKRGYGFVVDRLDGCGTDGVPVWDEAWFPLAPDGFIPSKAAPDRVSVKATTERAANP